MDDFRGLHRTVTNTNAKVDVAIKDIQELTEKIIAITGNVEEVVKLNERLAAVVWGGMDARAGFVSRITAIEQHLVSIQQQLTETCQQLTSTAAVVLTNSQSGMVNNQRLSGEISQTNNHENKAGLTAGIITVLTIVGTAIYQIIQLLQGSGK